MLLETTEEIEEIVMNRAAIFESPPFFSVTVGTWRSLPGDLTIAWFGDFPLHHFCWKHLWWQSCGALRSRTHRQLLSCKPNPIEFLQFLTMGSLDLIPKNMFWEVQLTPKSAFFMLATPEGGALWYLWRSFNDWTRPKSGWNTWNESHGIIASHNIQIFWLAQASQ